MKRTLTLFLGAILLVGASAFAAGAGGHWKAAGDHSQMMQQHAAFLAKALNLTADQQAAAKKLHEDLAAKAQPLMAQHRQQMQEIHALLDGGSADAADIGQKTIDAHATGQQLKALHDDFKTKFTALLSPDQLAKFQQMQAEHPSHGGHTPPAQ
ncbi:MAG TPA: periplasmic heavy metal sensor [Thermoanaerobaculia bacterium]|jgi:Spy/CpxP family protein refolding chaperone|nr:periplasmic heavy metal sensor [Thermoanaerobaculia bacterium]